MKSLDKVVSGTLKKLGMSHLYTEGKIKGKWETIVGPALAATTKVVSYREGCLTVEGASPAVCMELECHREEILQRLRREGLQVASLRFRVG